MQSAAAQAFADRLRTDPTLAAEVGAALGEARDRAGGLEALRAIARRHGFELSAAELEAQPPEDGAAPGTAPGPEELERFAAAMVDDPALRAQVEAAFARFVADGDRERLAEALAARAGERGLGISAAGLLAEAAAEE